MKSIQVIKEFSQLAVSMWPDDESFIHVAKPAEGLIGRRLQSHLFKIFHEIVCNDRGERRTHRHTVGLLVELAVESFYTAVQPRRQL
jgi:hypothetical protein